MKLRVRCVVHLKRSEAAYFESCAAPASCARFAVWWEKNRITNVLITIFAGIHLRMNYAERRRLRVPIGSGVSEAACKIVFSQRFKCAGMKWGIESGKPILALRVIALSGIWAEAREAMFE